MVEIPVARMIEVTKVKPIPDEDSYETDPVLFHRLQYQFKLNFKLDVAAVKNNTLCNNFLTDALHQEWLVNDKPVDVWCNHPHSLNEKFIRRAAQQHKKYNINILMIIPANCQSAKFWHDTIETETTVLVENHPLQKRPQFLKLGVKTKYPSRNAYRIVIWRKK